MFALPRSKKLDIYGVFTEKLCVSDDLLPNGIWTVHVSLSSRRVSSGGEKRAGEMTRNHADTRLGPRFHAPISRSAPDFSTLALLRQQKEDRESQHSGQVFSRPYRCCSICNSRLFSGADQANPAVR